MIGIYRILNLKNDWSYIGSSIDIDIRISEHFNNLSKNQHINQKLQIDFNKFGRDNFKFDILEETTDDQLLIREKYWLDITENLYNEVFIREFEILESDKARFLNRIVKLDNGCWKLGANTKEHRYTSFATNNTTIAAHRYSFAIHNPEADRSVHILHSCDNKYCVNPDHLSAGTHSENHKDRAIKGIGHKIDFETAQKIRKLYEPKSKNKILDYLKSINIKLSISQIDNILNNTSLKDPNYQPIERHKVLNEEIVKQMRLDHSNGMTVAEIAKTHGFKYHTTSKVIHRKNWAWV